MSPYTSPKDCQTIFQLNFSCGFFIQVFTSGLSVSSWKKKKKKPGEKRIEFCPWQNVFNRFIIGQERRKIKNREGKSQFQSAGMAAVGLNICFVYWAAVKSPCGSQGPPHGTATSQLSPDTDSRSNPVVKRVMWVVLGPMRSVFPSTWSLWSLPTRHSMIPWFCSCLHPKEDSSTPLIANWPHWLCGEGQALVWTRNWPRSLPLYNCLL